MRSLPFGGGYSQSSRMTLSRYLFAARVASTRLFCSETALSFVGAGCGGAAAGGGLFDGLSCECELAFEDFRNLCWRLCRNGLPEVFSMLESMELRGEPRNESFLPGIDELLAVEEDDGFSFR